MQITFYDKNMFETAVADNALMNAIKIKKASLTSLFEEATHQVEFEFSKEFGEWWGIRENGYLAFRFRGDFFRFSIVKFKEDAKTNTITIIGDYFNLEMLNENCIAYEKQPSRTIVQHFNAMEILPYANFEIGVNELANSTRVLTYTGDEVKYKRLISIINNFGGECEFEIKQKANGQFDKLILNIYKANNGVNYQGVGRNRRDLEITIDNSNNVSRMVDSTEIKTSIEPIGKDGLRLGNRGTTWKNEDGQVEFYQKNNRIYAPLAADEMQRVLDSDKFLLWKQSIDTDNVAKLESEGLKWLKNVCYAKENIEVSGSFDVRVGDTVILNHKGIGKYGILGSLRVTKIVWDLLTETNEVTFSNFKRLASKISAQGLALQNSIESPASYDIAFNTTAGQVFKNNTGVSTVSFNFKKNGLDAAVIGQRWYSGTQLLSTGLEFMVKPANLTNDLLTLRLEVDVTTGITFSKEITFLNVNDGAKGDTGNGVVSTENYYLVSASKTGITSTTVGWVRDIPQIASPTNKYHWHYHVDIYSNGTRKETIPAIIGIYGDKGADGVGINSSSIMYGVSASATVQPTNWTEAMPVAKQGEYLWKRTITDYTDPSKPDTIELTYSYQGKNGSAGTSLTVSKTEYQAGTSGTVAPTGTWTIAIPTVADGQFLWMKATMSDNSTIIVPTKQGAKGKDGVTYYPHAAYANKSKDIFYDSLPSFANSPGYQGGLVSSVPENGAYKITTTGGTHVMKTFVGINGTSGKALWTIVRLKNTHSTNNLRLVFNGIGDGTVLNGSFPTIVIKPGEEYFFMKSGVARSDYDFIQITFQSDSADKDLAFTLYEASFYNSSPFVNFSFVPNNHAYLGNYTDTLENASTDITKYNWSLTKGSDGKDGISVTNNIPSYVLSTSGTTAPTTGWSSSIPTLIKGRFLWTKNNLTLSDSTTKTSYFVTYIPNDGINGQTPVVHTAYANSQNGAVDFSITDSTNRRFIGQYVDYNSTNSTDPTKYKWLDMTANVKAGNNNLLLDTKSLSRHYWTANNTSETYLGGTVATSKAPSGSYQDTFRQAMKIAPEGNEFIVSFYAKSSIDNVTINNHFYSPNRTIKGISSTGALFNNVNGGDGLIAIKLTTQWKRYWIKWTIRDASSEAENVPMNVILGRNFDSVNSVSIALPALYVGNINTEHSDAPEDIQSSIDSKADQLLTQQQILALEEKTTLERENAIAEAMQNTISEVEQKWQLWYETNTKDEKQQVANDIASLMQRTAELDYKLGEASAKFSFINNETIIGEDGVAIGDKAGKAKLFMSGDSISFLTNGVAQMTLTGDTLSIKNGLFTERIQIGNFVEEVYDKNPLFNVIRAIKNS